MLLVADGIAVVGCCCCGLLLLAVVGFCGWLLWAFVVGCCGLVVVGCCGLLLSLVVVGCHSVSQSLNQSITHSIVQSLAQSLSHSITHSPAVVWKGHYSSCSKRLSNATRRWRQWAASHKIASLILQRHFTQWLQWLHIVQGMQTHTVQGVQQHRGLALSACLRSWRLLARFAVAAKQGRCSLALALPRHLVLYLSPASVSAFTSLPLCLYLSVFASLPCSHSLSDVCLLLSHTASMSRVEDGSSRHGI